MCHSNKTVKQSKLGEHSKTVLLATFYRAAKYFQHLIIFEEMTYETSRELMLYDEGVATAGLACHTYVHCYGLPCSSPYSEREVWSQPVLPLLLLKSV